MMALFPVGESGPADYTRPWLTETTKRAIPPAIAATSLALIPITLAVFRKPMAHALMGGGIVGLVLTLQFLLALYVTWFRAEAPGGAGIA